MNSIYLINIPFHIPTTAEKEEIRTFQRRHATLCWFKRFLISFGFIGIAIVLQLIAIFDITNTADDNMSIEKLLIYGTFSFVAFNILSSLQLLLQTHILFRIKKNEILKVQVKKKVVVDEIMRYTNIRIKYKYLSCQLPDGTFILNKIYAPGPIAFSCIKAGQDIYIKRHHTKDGDSYYYVA